MTGKPLEMEVPFVGRVSFLPDGSEVNEASMTWSMPGETSPEQVRTIGQKFMVAVDCMEPSSGR